MAAAESYKVSKQLAASTGVSREGSYHSEGIFCILFLFKIIFAPCHGSAYRWFWMPVIHEWKCEIEYLCLSESRRDEFPLIKKTLFLFLMYEVREANGGGWCTQKCKKKKKSLA